MVYSLGLNVPEPYQMEPFAVTILTFDPLARRAVQCTANFLVNRRMNKSQQMRWSPRGADLLLQVRCAAYNGTLGAGFGHRFDRMPKPGTERTVVDRATNLQQRISAISRPSHLLGLVHAPVDQEVRCALGD